jgi:hypothetical protein
MGNGFVNVNCQGRPFSVLRHDLLNACVLVQREIESGRSWLASIQRFRGPVSRDTAQYSRGASLTGELATGFEKKSG